MGNIGVPPKSMVKNMLSLNQRHWAIREEEMSITDEQNEIISDLIWGSPTIGYSKHKKPTNEQIIAGLIQALKMIKYTGHPPKDAEGGMWHLYSEQIRAIAREAIRKVEE